MPFCWIAAFSRDESGSKCTHDTGNVRADGLAACDFLKASQNSIIVEGTALNHNVFAQVGCAGDLDDLKQRVLDDGVSKTGGDIRNGSALPSGPV